MYLTFYWFYAIQCLFQVPVLLIKFSNFTLLISVTDVMSQFVMLYMMLSLSLGWAQAAAYKYHHSTLAQLKEKPAAKIVAAIGLLQVRLKYYYIRLK